MRDTRCTICPVSLTGSLHRAKGSKPQKRMELIQITAESREAGKKNAKQIRKNEAVPCVLYGNGIAPVHFALPLKAFKPLIYTRKKVVIELTIDGVTQKCILKEASFHPTSDLPIHVDFQALVEGGKVKTSLPLHVNGVPVGVTAGGALKRVIHRVKVLADAEKMPAFINVDVTNLKIGDVARVGQLEADGVQFITPASQAIAMVVTKRK